MSTTVQVSDATKDALEEEKDHPRESYDQVIQDLLHERKERLRRKISRAKEQESRSHEDVKEALQLT